MMQFDQPIGTDKDRAAAKAWAGGWFDATGFAQHYINGGKPAYHTGADLNLPNFGDSNQPVFASATGEVVGVGKWPGWAGLMVVIRHDTGVWTRYAHLGSVIVERGQVVQRGERLGNIGDYPPAGRVQDHLHFDVARIDLGAKPGDWPGMDIDRLKRDYINPREWINTHRGDASWWFAGDGGAPVRTQMNTDDGTLITAIPAGMKFRAEPVRDGQWLKVQITADPINIGADIVTRSTTPFDGYILRMAVNDAG